ncbi:type II toxin-antitoxin system RelE/ParE family toxin [Coraliomargarita parva]|uniref:type II toxin-antitoxin system RelE/ParE family toxin n=1 Tax=Coraliomargarita parva TaxID=3014050 RepID=UPI0022B470FB|nr:type II toxin-antitoxin system RelE/ParE family toxin [Coraliomargarita parva]
MIQSFKGKTAKALWEGKRTRLSSDITWRAIKKLSILDAAVSLDSLRIPPSNHLEALSGDRKGQHSIRINNQWRLCFRWEDGNAYEVEITDYH